MLSGCTLFSSEGDERSNKPAPIGDFDCTRASQDVWNSYQGGSSNSGFRESRILNPTETIGSATIPVDEQLLGKTGVVQKENHIVCGSLDGAVCIDRESGDTTWGYEGTGRSAVTPTIGCGTVLFQTDRETVGLDLDGNLKWELDENHGSLDSQNVYSDGVFFCPSSGSVLAIGPNEGEVFWRYDIDNLIHGCAVYGNSIVATAGADNLEGKLYSIDKSSGELLWESGTLTSTEPPVIHGDSVFVHTLDSTLAKLDASNGDILWQRKTSASGSFPKPTIDESSETVLLPTNNNGGVDAFTTGDGDRIWSKSYDSVVKSPVVIGSEYAYVGGNTVHIIDPRNGEKLASEGPRVDSPMMLGQNSVYAISSNRLVKIHNVSSI